MRLFSLHCILSKLVKHPPLCICTVKRIKRSAAQLKEQRHHSAPTLPYHTPSRASRLPHLPQHPTRQTKENNPRPIRTPSSQCLPPLRSQIRPHPLQKLLPRRARARQQTPLSDTEQPVNHPFEPERERKAGRKVRFRTAKVLSPLQASASFPTSSISTGLGFRGFSKRVFCTGRCEVRWGGGEKYLHWDLSRRGTCRCPRWSRRRRR